MDTTQHTQPDTRSATQADTQPTTRPDTQAAIPPTAVASASAPGPDLSHYRAIHRTLRAANEMLVTGIDGLPAASPRPAIASALQRWYTGYRGELGGHHDLEDRLFFPALAERVPSFTDYAATLDADHQRIDELMDSVGEELDRLTSGSSWPQARTDALAAAIELRDLLARHLDVEDRDILPMFERHFEADEYAQIEKEAMSTVSGRQALFTVPWFMAMAPPEAAAHTLATAPLALKVVYRLTRRRYARLEVAAFGPGPASARTAVRASTDTDGDRS